MLLDYFQVWYLHLLLLNEPVTIASVRYQELANRFKNVYRIIYRRKTVRCHQLANEQQRAVLTDSTICRS